MFLLEARKEPNMGFRACKKLIAASLFSLASCTALFSQTDFENNLAKHTGNKIILLGEWKPGDIAKWVQVLDSEELYGHGFALLDRAKFSRSDENYRYGARDIAAFERWLIQRLGLSGAARWAALDVGNKLIVSGQQIPGPKEFDQMLEEKGVKTPIRKLRDFLRQNPGHIDAASDLLKEARRRALHVMPKDVSEDLDDEADLRTWAIMASETDKAFSGDWLGIDLNFFEPDWDQPEQFSRLMRAVFRKQSPKVESALVLDPANGGLWNIWAWMARGMGDYRWDTFIGSIGQFRFELNYGALTCPSPKTCVWLVADAKAKRDWGMVTKLARTARGFRQRDEKSTLVIEWTPGWVSVGWGNDTSIKDYPFKSAFAPHIEALLRLGDIEEANKVYDEMIRFSWYPDKNAENAIFAVEAAKAAGMEELAKLWEKGELVNKVPYRGGREGSGPSFYAFTEWGSDFSKNLDAMLSKLNPPSFATKEGPWKDHTTLGWKTADGDRWGLMDENGLLVAQGTDIPDAETMQRHWDSLNYVSPFERLRRYLAGHSDQPGMAISFSLLVISQNVKAHNQNSADTKPNPTEYESASEEAIWHLKRVISDYPNVLVNLPDSSFVGSVARSIEPVTWPDSMDNSAIKPLSGPFLAAIETALERKPSSEQLWEQWFFWRSVEGAERSVEQMAARLHYSPLSGDSMNPMGLPTFAINIYYNECKKNGNWAKLAELIKPVWERELFRAMELKNGPVEDPRRDPAFTGAMGNRVGIPLIEAYLNDNKFSDANEVFNAWLGSGNTFRDISKIAELAKAKGQERLAQEWETKIKK
jgi:pentatricopeptide repeat protein